MVKSLSLAPHAAEPLPPSYEAARRLAELESIYAHAPVGLCVLDTDLRWLRINERLAEINGLPAAAHVGRTLRELLPNLADQAESILRQVIASGEPLLSVEVVGETPAQPGVERVWLESFFPLRDDRGRINAVNVVCEEVTARRAAERAARESERRLELALEAGELGLWDWHIPSGHLHISGRWASMLGYDLASLEPHYRTWEQLVHPDDQPEVTRLLANHVQGRTAYYEAVYRLRCRTGEWRWVRARGRVVEWDASGQSVRAIGTHEDVHARQQAEDALRASEARFRAAVEHLPHGIVLYSPDRRMQYMNAWALRASRLGEGAYHGKRDEELFSPDITAGYLARLEHALATAAPVTFDWELPPEHGRLYLRVTYLPLLGPDGTVAQLLALTLDLTSQKRAEEALRASEERFRLAAEAVNGLIYDHDRVTGGIERTRGLLEVLGYRPEEVPAAIDWWHDQIHPDDRPRLLDRLQAPGDANSRVEFEYRVRHRDGHYLHVVDRSLLVRDPSGQVVRQIGCTQDVTRLREAMDALREADRRKDEFLATLAHELRNPLAPLGNALEMLRLAPDPATVGRVRDLMDRQLRHLVRLVDDLLEMSRIRTGKVRLRPERIDLREAVRQAVETSRPHLEARQHTLVEAAAPGVLPIEADPARVVQVVSNLLNNAARYTEPGGRIELSVASVHGAAEVRVRDSGVGIAADILPRVFDLFAQGGASSDGGLGIGLSLVKGLVELHGGTVEAHSPGPGQGSEFVVRLPLAGATGPAVPAAAPLRPAGRRRVVVADDNRDAADSLTALLRALGHEAHTTYDGAEAVAAAEALRPELIILDLGMPGVDGLEAARQIRARPWGKQIVLLALTGWGQPEDHRRTREAGFDHHLVKPIAPGSLTRILASTRPAGA